MGKRKKMDLHRGLTLQGVERLANEQDIIVTGTGNDMYLIQITTSSEAVAMTLQCLRLLMSVSGRIHGQVRREMTHERSAAMVLELRKDEQAIAKCYWDMRDKGYKHRACIEIAQEQAPSLTGGRRRYDKTNVGHCVKTYPREYFLTELPVCNALIVDEGSHDAVLS
jgi:hypothetical protein